MSIDLIRVRLLSVALVGRLDERSSDLDEVLEVAVGLSSSARGGGLSLVLPDDVSEDLGPSVVGDLLAGWEVGLLLGDGLIEEALDLVLERGLAGLS